MRTYKQGDLPGIVWDPQLGRECARFGADGTFETGDAGVAAHLDALGYEGSGDVQGAPEPEELKAATTSAKSVARRK